VEDTQAPAVNAEPSAPVVEATTVTDSAPVETNTSAPTEPVQTDTVVTDDTAQPTQPVQDNVEAEHQQPRPAQRRIQQLVEENKQLKGLVGQAPVPTQPLPTPRLSEILQGRDSVDPSELDQIGEQLVAQAASGLVDLKVANLEMKLVQEKAADTLIKDTEAITKIPELDEKNPDTFIPELDKKIADRYNREAVKVNPYNPKLRMIDPSVRLADIAKEELETWNKAVERGKATASSSLSDLADSLSINPGGSDSKVEKPFEELSLKEMEARLRAQGHQV